MAVRLLGAGSSVRVVQEYLALDDPRIGVVYGSTTDQSARVQAALDLAAAAGGGTVFCGGAVRCGGTEIAWPTSGGAVHLIGNGQGDQANQSGSSLYWPDDSGSAPLAGDSAGTHFGIRVPLGALGGSIRDICIQGPGQTVAIGDMPANSYGIFIGTRFELCRVRVNYWGAGIGIINDHQMYDRVDARGNGYALDFMDNISGGIGDLTFHRCYFNDQTRASIAISASNCIANARFEGNGHCGAAPYGVYRYAGQAGVARGGQAMSGVVFENWSFEYCGNAMIYDEAGGGSFVNIEFNSPGEFGTGGSAKWPGKPNPMAKIHIDYGEDFQWRLGPVIPQSDNPNQPVVSAKDFSGAVIDDPRNLFDAAVNAGHKSFVLRAGSAGSKFVNCVAGTKASPDGLMLGWMEASEDILRGSLVEMVGTNQVQESRNGLSSQIVGVSLIDYAEGDVCEYVMAGSRSGLVVRNASGSTITNGALMTPDPAHQGCVKAAASLNDLIVGRAHDGSITTGTTGPIMVSL